MASFRLLCRIGGSVFGSNCSKLFCTRAPQLNRSSVSLQPRGNLFKLGVVAKPKRATHFGLFIKLRLTRLVKEFPGKKQGELFGIAAQQYKLMSEEERKQLNVLVQRANKKFKDEISFYNEVCENDEALRCAFQAESELRKALKEALKPYRLYKKDRMKSPEIQALSPSEQEDQIQHDWTEESPAIRKKYQDQYKSMIIDTIKSTYNKVDKMEKKV